MKLRYGFVLSIIVAGSALANVAQAQQQPLGNTSRNKTYDDSRSRLKVERPQQKSVDELGYPLSNGILVSPSVRVENGYDSNPDKLFNEQHSPYSLIDNSLVFGYVQPDAATTLALKSAFAEFYDLDRSERWDAGVSLDTYRVLQPGLEFNGGAFYLRDSLSYTENESLGAYGQTEYKNEFLELYGRSVAHQVRYLSQPAIDPSIASQLQPYLYNYEYNSERLEQTAGVLFWRNKLLGAYMEGGAAAIDYIDQKQETLLDRDAEDLWAIAGIRVTLPNYLRADIGYRFNHRNLDDSLISDYDSGYLDAKIIWLPRSDFRATFEVDRKIGEPSAALSRLSDITHYALTFDYKLTPRIDMSLKAYHKRSKEIGDAVSYMERGLQSETTYDLNNKSQLYFQTLWGHVKEEISQSAYDRFSVGMGLRMKFNAAPNEPWGDIFSELHSQRMDNKLLTVQIGSSHLYLPETKMTTVTDAFLTESLYHNTDHDGYADGYKLDFNLADIVMRDTNGFYQTQMKLKGFYGHYQKQDHSVCEFNANTDCLFVNLTDVNTGDDNNTGAFGRLVTETSKDVHHWGVSLDSPLMRETPTGSLKDRPAVVSKPSDLRLGIAVKAIQQETHLDSIDVSVPDPVDYDEHLNTYYYGVYLGYQKRLPLSQGLSLNVNAEAGLYYADADYQGRYLAYFPIGGGVYQTDFGTSYLSQQRESFIGSVQLDLEKNIGWANLSIFGQAEYYSYVPRVSFNNVDLAGGGILDLNGPRNGTALVNDDAYSLTIGGRVSIPLGDIN